jgi:hypothetical protein
VFQDLTELEKRLELERRRHRRKAAARSIAYVTAPPGVKQDQPSFSADLLDISDAGTRIRTACRLEPGSLIRFRNSVNNASGIVRWTAVEEKSDFCVAGIQFIGPERK